MPADQSVISSCASVWNGQPRLLSISGTLEEAERTSAEYALSSMTLTAISRTLSSNFLGDNRVSRLQFAVAFAFSCEATEFCVLRQGKPTFFSLSRSGTALRVGIDALGELAAALAWVRSGKCLLSAAVEDDTRIAGFGPKP